jgi:hypothetical protein
MRVLADRRPANPVVFCRSKKSICAGTDSERQAILPSLGQEAPPTGPQEGELGLFIIRQFTDGLAAHFCGWLRIDDDRPAGFFVSPGLRGLSAVARHSAASSSGVSLTDAVRYGVDSSGYTDTRRFKRLIPQ